MNDNNLIPLFVAGSLLLTLFSFFLIVYLLVQKRQQNKYILEKQKMIFDHQNGILRAKIEEHETVMDQMSKELHDNVKSVLGLAQMNMYVISDLAANERQATLIDNTNKILGRVIDDLHSISHSLTGNFVKRGGLIETLQNELENIRLSKDITCNFEVVGEAGPLSSDKELHIYRIAQEVIQNCVKHAKATIITFELVYEPDRFIMKMTDNGVGFDDSASDNMKGLGFINMAQRASYVHGTLDVRSAPKKGTTITLTVNLDEHGGE